MTSHSINSTIAVIGAGNMGSGIAQKYATHGYHVIVADTSEQSLEKSRNAINELLNQGVLRGVFSDQETREIIERITFTTHLTDCKNASLIVEAIFEDLPMKRLLFRRLEDICAQDTILATNTSSFMVAELQAGLAHPERVLGLHYFFHPAKNRLVEIIGGALTNASTLLRAENIQESINKIVIKSKDSPGFIVNRFFVPWLNEAMRIVDEGIGNIATVDACAKEFFKIGMGPFQLMNVTGLPITLHACHTLMHHFGDFYAPCPTINTKIDSKSLWDLTGDVDTRKFDKIAMRLLSVVGIISCQMVYDERVTTIADVDLGARVGLLWQKGPFELLNSHLKEIGQTVLAHKPARFLPVPKILEQHLVEAKPFLHSNVLIEKAGNVGIIKLNKPDTLNALDVNLKNDLAQAFYTLTNEPNIDAIVIAGHRRAFMAGADLSFFNHNLDHKRIDKIVEFAKSAQELFFAIDQSIKPVVAAISGMALGGGLELALACDAIIATANAKFAFPETGIGIYPGLGGTQRTPLRVGIPLARYLILTGTSIDGLEAKSMGLVDEIASEKDLLSHAIILANSITPGNKMAAFTPNQQAYKDLAAAFQNAYGESQSEVTTERAEKAIARITRKAPLAIAIADQLITKANADTMAAGLELETSNLESIFKSEDAYAGLRAAMLKGRVTFVGK